MQQSLRKPEKSDDSSDKESGEKVDEKVGQCPYNPYIC